MDYETPDILVRVQDHVTIVRVRTVNLTSMGDIGRLTGALDGLVKASVQRRLPLSR